MSVDLPPLNALRAFEAAARLGRIGRAADELHVTHAAVSHQVAKLEAWFGAPLFRRQGRGVRLTDTGRELARVLTRNLEELADTCTDLRRRNERPRVTIACIPSVATRWLVPRLNEFTEANPDIRLHFVHALTPDLLEPGAAELVIRDVTGTPPPDITCETLFPGASRPVCSPHWLHRHGSVREPRDLIDATLLHDGDEGAWRQWFERHELPSTGEHVDGPVYQDFNLLSTAAIAGHGVALCPLALIGGDIARGDLVQLFETGANEDRRYCMLYREAPGAAASRLREWIRGLAGLA